MGTGQRKAFSGRIRAAFLSLIAFLFVSIGYGQTFQPGQHIVINDALGPANATPTDSRSMFYDVNFFLYRDYNGPTEVLTYLNLSKYRTGGFPIMVHSGGSLSGGIWTGGTRLVYWFKNGTADSNLVRWYTDSSSASCSGCLLASNNLNDVANANTARANLGLGTISTQSATASGGDLSGTWPAPTVSRFNGQLPSYYLNYLNLTNTPAIPSQLNPTGLGLTSITGVYPNLTWNTRTPGLQETITSNNATSKTDSINIGAFLFRFLGTSALGVPSGTTAQRPSSPASGDTRWNTDSLALESWNGSAWVHPTGGGGGGGGITALTGDGSASGTGSVPFTLATVNSNVFGSNTFLKFGVNGKGLVTSATAVGSGDIISALGFTPYNATNPSGYISLSSLSANLPIVYNSGTGNFTLPLTSSHIFVGNGSNVATDVAMSGDGSISNTGVLTITKRDSLFGVLDNVAGQNRVVDFGSTNNFNVLNLSNLSFQGDSSSSSTGLSVFNMHKVDNSIQLYTTSRVFPGFQTGFRSSWNSGTPFAQLYGSNGVTTGSENHDNYWRAYKDSLVERLYNGNAYYIEGLNAASDSTSWKPLVINTTTGEKRQLSFWPGGGGTITGAGNFSPLFNTGVSGSSITFTALNAAANTVFGNFTGSSAAAGFGKVTLAAQATNTANYIQGWDGSGNPTALPPDTLFVKNRVSGTGVQIGNISSDTLYLDNLNGSTFITQTKNTDSSITTSIANSTANTLLGWNGSGIPVNITAGTNITISGGVISASGGGGGTIGGAISAGQVAYGTASNTIGGDSHFTNNSITHTVFSDSVNANSIVGDATSLTTIQFPHRLLTGYGGYSGLLVKNMSTSGSGATQLKITTASEKGGFLFNVLGDNWPGASATPVLRIFGNQPFVQAADSADFIWEQGTPGVSAQEWMHYFYNSTWQNASLLVGNVLPYPADYRNHGTTLFVYGSAKIMSGLTLNDAGQHYYVIRAGNFHDSINYQGGVGAEIRGAIVSQPDNPLMRLDSVGRARLYFYNNSNPAQAISTKALLVDNSGNVKLGGVYDTAAGTQNGTAVLYWGPNGYPTSNDSKLSFNYNTNVLDVRSTAGGMLKADSAALYHGYLRLADYGGTYAYVAADNYQLRTTYVEGVNLRFRVVNFTNPRLDAFEIDSTGEIRWLVSPKSATSADSVMLMATNGIVHRTTISNLGTLIGASSTNIYNSDGTLSANRNLSGGNFSLSLGTSGSPISTLTQRANNITLWPIVGAGGELKMFGTVEYGNAGTTVDANFNTADARDFFLAGNITATRTVNIPLPSNSGISGVDLGVYIQNATTSTNKWIPSSALYISPYDSITSLATGASYNITSDGTRWNLKSTSPGIGLVIESSAGTLTLATATDYIFNGSTSTWTLPSLNANQGRRYHIKNAGSGNITLGISGSDQIFDTSPAVSSITITPGQAVIMVGGQSFWYKE